MSKKPLIVGVDPGTTLGYAMLDINGELVGIDSPRDVGLNELIRLVFSVGRPVLVCTDKKHVPKFVERFAASIGARLIRPEEDMPVRYKNKLTKRFRVADYHQMDSLAAALYGFKRIRSLLERVDIFCRENSKEGINDKIKEIVVKRGISVKKAVGLLERKEVEEKIVEKVEKKRELKEEDFVKLVERGKRLEKEVSLLKGGNRRLMFELNKVEEVRKKVEPVKIDKKMEKMLEFKEERIKGLDKRVREREKVILLLQGEIARLYSFLAESGSKVILKKFDNLGVNEFQRKNLLLNVRKGDVLLVEDMNIFSDKVIDFLKEMSSFIVYKKKVSDKLKEEMPFVLIDGKHLEVEEERYFGVADKAAFNEEVKKCDILSKLVRDYRKERLHLE